ncbi:hypothetical protein KAW38_02695 [Candidatus Micrarchaeota archaeon]|nr:hypothetical protein [Candidatus Micrarchaeota archaeon]
MKVRDDAPTLSKNLIKMKRDKDSHQRIHILELLKENYLENPFNYVTSKSISEELGNPPKFDSYVKYLEEKGYINAMRSLGTTSCMMQINAYGIDFLEKEVSRKGKDQEPLEIKKSYSIDIEKYLLDISEKKAVMAGVIIAILLTLFLTDSTRQFLFTTLVIQLVGIPIMLNLGLILIVFAFYLGIYIILYCYEISTFVDERTFVGAYRDSIFFTSIIFLLLTAMIFIIILILSLEAIKEMFMIFIGMLILLPVIFLLNSTRFGKEFLVGTITVILDPIKRAKKLLNILCSWLEEMKGGANEKKKS